MSKFPKYYGNLPECLDPFKIRDYFLLAFWVYFQPTTLHCYLHQAAPEFYDDNYSRFANIWKIPEYRNIFLMGIPGIISFLLMIVTIIISIQSYIYHKPLLFIPSSGLFLSLLVSYFVCFSILPSVLFIGRKMILNAAQTNSVTYNLIQLVFSNTFLLILLSLIIALVIYSLIVIYSSTYIRDNDPFGVTEYSRFLLLVVSSSLGLFRIFFDVWLTTTIIWVTFF
jgi:hypothetical protein